MDPDDPLGKDDVLVSEAELHLPIDRPVKVNLRSKDVLHNFTVTQFRVKMDMVPGMVSYLCSRPQQPGASRSSAKSFAVSLTTRCAVRSSLSHRRIRCLGSEQSYLSRDA